MVFIHIDWPRARSANDGEDVGEMTLESFCTMSWFFYSFLSDSSI